jgi:ERF superfamily
MSMESEQIADLATALAKAQGVMGPAIINKQNPYFKTRYADLAAVFDAVRKPLADNGLSITQTTQLRDGALILRTTLRHSTGQWIASDYPLPLNAKPQDLGSALTYGRRYELSAIVGVAADEDDDGEGAQKINGNGAEYNASDLQSMTDALSEASKNGLDALRDAWLKLPKEARDTLKAALERRFKPDAEKADAEKGAQQ